MWYHVSTWSASHLDLAKLTAALFVAFMAHDALQETLARGTPELGSIPLLITSLDFIGCAAWSWACLTWEAPTTPTGAVTRRTRSSSSGQRTGNVQVEHINVQPDLEVGSNSKSQSGGHGHGGAPQAQPFSTYAMLGLMILASNCLGIAALGYVDYPLKVIIRSCKLIPTMVIGRFVIGRRYELMQYAAATLLCIGVILFSLADMAPVNPSPVASFDLDPAASTHPRRLLNHPTASPVAHTLASDSAFVLFGIALLSLSVVVDAINPNVAEYFMNKKAAGAKGSNGGAGGGHGGKEDIASVNRFMFGTNSAVLPLILVALVCSGELTRTIPHLTPGLIVVMLLYSCASYAGVRAYTALIQRHGSATAVGLATLRKIATLALSYAAIPDIAQSATDAVAGTLAPERPVHPKHFGSAQLLPSALILAGLVMSAWIEKRKQQGPTTGAAATSATNLSIAVATPPRVSEGTNLTSRRAYLDQRDVAAESELVPLRARSSSNDAPPRFASSTSPASRLHASPHAVSTLAHDLGLVTDPDADTESDLTDTDGGGEGRRGRVMAKHDHHFSQTLEHAMREQEHEER